jgi:hypothetical protein
VLFHDQPPLVFGLTAASLLAISRNEIRVARKIQHFLIKEEISAN